MSLAACPGGEGAVFVFYSAEGANEESLHLGGGTSDCGRDVGGVVGDGECLVVPVTDFETAAFVLRS